MELKFGEALKKARLAKRKTISEVSAHVKKSISYISDVEHERKLPPDSETVRKIEDFLGVGNGNLERIASEARKKAPSSLSQRLQARPLLSELLLRADNMSDEEIKDWISKLTKKEE